MKNTSLSPLFLVAAVGLGIWGGWEHNHRARLEKELQSALSERDTLRVTANRKVALTAKTDVKSGGPQGLGPEHAEELKAEQDAGKKPEAANKMMGGIADMMKDPAMRDMMKTQMRGQIETQYRDLFDLLDLDQGQRDNMGKVLAERQSSGMDIGLALMSGETLSPEEKKAKETEMKQLKEKSEAELKTLLGEEKYGEFERFEKSQPERMQLSTLNNQLRDKGLALSTEAESQLMDAMYQERTAFKYDNDLSDQNNMDTSRFTEENLKRFEEQNAELQQKVLSRASEILTAEQLDVFQKSQEQQSSMMKMSMKMAAKMFQEDKSGN